MCNATKGCFHHFCENLITTELKKKGHLLFSDDFFNTKKNILVLYQQKP